MWLFSAIDNRLGIWILRCGNLPSAQRSHYLFIIFTSIENIAWIWLIALNFVANAFIRSIIALNHTSIIDLILWLFIYLLKCAHTDSSIKNDEPFDVHVSVLFSVFFLFCFPFSFSFSVIYIYDVATQLSVSAPHCTYAKCYNVY